MKLSKEEKNIIRNDVVKRLQSVPEGQRIHISDKEVLEELLFDTVTFKHNGNTIRFRLPIWSGSFLRKIDLSEVSFDDVAWSLLHDEVMIDELETTFNIDSKEFESIYKESIEEHIPFYKSGECPKVDYSLTNAKINFTDSFEFKRTGGIRMENCDFFGVDMSNTSAVGFKWCFDCDLANTGLKITPEMFPRPPFTPYVFGNTNLSNLDLSKFVVNMVDLFSDQNYFWDTCDFTNTGIYFILNKQELDDAISKNYITEEDFRKLVENRIMGCYVNGTKIMPYVETSQIVNEEEKPISK